MQKTLREHGTNAQIARLEKKHVALEGAISEMDALHYLTDAEQIRIQALKRERLAAKDELMDLRRQTQTS
jgi:hypothetical protein